MPTMKILSRDEVQPEKKRASYKCVQCGAETDGFIGTQRYDGRICRDCFGRREDRRPKDLNELTGKEWAEASRSVAEYPDTRSEKQRLHGACFPVSLALQHIQMFTKSGQTVLDPFVGVGTTVDAARILGRRAIGIDISRAFLDIAKSDLDDNDDSIRLICDDARNMNNYINPESIDLLLTSPPYAHLLKGVKGAFAYKWREHSRLDPIVNPTPYSSSERDLGNMSYDEFFDALAQIMSHCYVVMKEGSYSVWVVKDFRDLKNRVPYVNFHGDVISCAEAVGFTLWDIRIYDQTRYRPLVCLGYPSKNFYLNIGHSYILIFRKR